MHNVVHTEMLHRVYSQKLRGYQNKYTCRGYNKHLGQIWIVSGSDVTDSEGKMGRQSALRNNFHHPYNDFKGHLMLLQ